MDLKELLLTNLKNKRIVITGCGYKPLKKKFKDIHGNLTHNSIFVNGIEMKLNVGSGIALFLASEGAIIHMVSKTMEKLENLKQEFIKLGINDKLIEYTSLDLLNEKEVNNFVNNLSKDKTIYWVQSVGLGAGSYKLKDDNPYLPVNKIPLELLEKETTTVLKSTHIMLNSLLPVFEKQKETKIIIISSMSAIRGYSLGGTHCAAKGAIDRYANSVMLGLYKKNIFLTTIRPGAVDTGMYDNEVVQKAIFDVCDEYGSNWRKDGLKLISPISLGKIIFSVFTNDSHITSLNVVSRSQLPNEGS